MSADAAQLTSTPAEVDLPARLVGAIAPHAGWVCSGRVAGLVLRALADQSDAVTFFLTGSVHTMELTRPALSEADRWQTPLGEVAVDVELRDALAAVDGFELNEDPHRYEHALEVQLPLMQHLWGERLRIVPCMIPPVSEATDWGAALGDVLRDWPEPVVMLASSDLTHYGPNYDYQPAGPGAEGYRWAHEVNDRALIDRMVAMRADRIVAQAAADRSACGGGAIAAVMAASARLGAQSGYLLEHTDSTRELAPLGYGDEHNSVGYAGIVFG